MEIVLDATHAAPSFDAKRLSASLLAAPSNVSPAMSDLRAITFSFLPRYAPTNPYAMKSLKAALPASPELLGIPLELRLQVYHHLLKDHVIQLFHSLRVREAGTGDREDLHILYVCREIRKEILPVLFAKCPLQLSHVRPARLSLRINKSLLDRVITLDILSHLKQKVPFNELSALKYLRFKVPGVIYLYEEDANPDSGIYLDVHDKLMKHIWIKQILKDKTRKFMVIAECLCKPRQWVTPTEWKPVNKEAFFAAVDMDIGSVFRKCPTTYTNNVMEDEQKKIMSD